MIQTCKQCGAINQASTERCCFCEALLNVEAGARVSAAAAAGAATTSSRTAVVAEPPEWRDEIANRMRSYRARKNGEQTDIESEAPQDELPFEASADTQSSADEMEDPLQAALASAATRLVEHPQIVEPEIQDPKQIEPTIFERLEIDVSRLAIERSEELPLPANARRFEGVLDPRIEPVYPVASLQVRRRAGIIDATILALASLAIFSGFIALGGRFEIGKMQMVICVATVGLLAAQYFTLFTVLGGTTPGMMISGLRLVTFEGEAPTPVHLIWRSIGYQISAGTAFLGYLWALWDEDALTWHDRISQTYITAAETASFAESHEAHSSGEAKSS